MGSGNLIWKIVWYKVFVSNSRFDSSIFALLFVLRVELMEETEVDIVDKEALLFRILAISVPFTTPLFSPCIYFKLSRTSQLSSLHFFLRIKILIKYLHFSFYFMWYCYFIVVFKKCKRSKLILNYTKYTVCIIFQDKRYFTVILRDHKYHQRQFGRWLELYKKN